MASEQELNKESALHKEFQSLLDKDYFIFGYAEDYFVSTKAKVPLKVLVTLANKYLEPLEDQLQ